MGVMATLFPASFGAAATLPPNNASDPRPVLQQQVELPDAPPTPAAIATAQATEGISPIVAKTANAASPDTLAAVTVAATVNDPTTQERVYRRWVAAAVAVMLSDPLSNQHPQRLALAGAILQNGLARTLLVELVLTSPTCLTNVLNFAGTPGGVMLDTDIDYVIANLFPAVAIARNW